MITWHLTNEPISSPHFTGLRDPKVVSLVGRLGRTGWHTVLDDRLPVDHVYCGPVEVDCLGHVDWSGWPEPVVSIHPASIATIGKDIEDMRASNQAHLADTVREACKRLFGGDGWDDELEEWDRL